MWHIYHTSILEGRHLEQTFVSREQLDTNVERDFFIGFQLNTKLGSDIYNIGLNRNPTVRTKMYNGSY